jgi:alkylation response protein AidB-like acyl-CoA dehydrogenase
VDFSFTPEQEDLRREARAFLEANPRPSMEQLAELGWVGILRGEDFGFLDAAVLFEELGRALYDGPFVLNEVAGQPGDEIWSIEIDGFVPHLAQVQRVLTPEMQAAAADGEAVATVDETLGLGRLSRNGADRAQGDWPEIRRRLLAALALEAVGIAQRMLELSVEHAKTREQFGRPIGVYQAVSHALADTYAETELARSLAYWAAWCVAEQDEQATLAAPAAKAFAADAAVAACERAIQVHGGVGFTWEHVLHRYYKRAQWIEAFEGFGHEQRAAVARELLDVRAPAAVA